MVTILKISYIPYIYKKCLPPINTYSYNLKNYFYLEKLKKL